MSSTRTVPYRRRREDKTNYKKRIKLIIGKKPRLVVRKSLKNLIAQIIIYDQKGDKIIGTAHTKELKKYDWNFGCGNIPSAYLVGLLLGKKVIAKDKEAVVDLGLQSTVKGTRLYAVVKGAIDAGIQIQYGENIFPDDKRIRGEHIANNPLEKNLKLKEMPAVFDKCKEKIMKI